MIGFDISHPGLPSRAAEYVWRQVLEAAGQNEHPTQAELAKLVARHGVPDAAREYVAGRLRNDFDLGDGGRPRAAGRWVLTIQRVLAIEILRAAFECQGVKAPKRRAEELVARQQGIIPDSLRRTIRRGLKEVPEWLSAKIEWPAVVNDLVAQGRAELDSKHGLTWSEDSDAACRSILSKHWPKLSDAV